MWLGMIRSKDMDKTGLLHLLNYEKRAFLQLEKHAASTIPIGEILEAVSLNSK